MPGRRPIPTRLKILNGNPGRRPLNTDEPKPPRGIPPLPRWLRSFPEAVRAWRRKAKELDAVGVLTIADAETLASWAYAYSQVQALAEFVKVHGRTVPTAQGVKSSPEAVQLAQMLSEQRALGALLGLDPSSRVRLRVEKPKAPGKVEAFRRSKHGA